jgi:Kef-type K+ transport system membrane component KefB
MDTIPEPTCATPSSGIIIDMMKRILALAGTLSLMADNASASSGGQTDPVLPVILALAVILASAKLAGHLAARVGQPAVLGELLAGVILGNLALGGVPWFEPIKSSSGVDILAKIGVIILLFEVGLESTVRGMMKVGATSLLVATLGVIAPFFLGWWVGALLLPDQGIFVHVFLGATLTATSVGITARVLQDLGRSGAPEARVIIGAAVIDDVMGLVVLAGVTGIITAADAGMAVSWNSIAAILAKALAFLLGALALGTLLSPRLFSLASRLRGQGVLLATALAFCFLLSWLSALVGLSPIVGAYAAGLILEDLHFRDFARKGEKHLEELVHPLSSTLTPVFFVLMGMHVDLKSFLGPGVATLAGLLTLAAVIGKQTCSLGAPRTMNRLAVGIGMIPRGEVGLIFASIGLGLTIAGEPVVTREVYSAVVAMVIATTLMTPPALKWALSRSATRKRT